MIDSIDVRAEDGQVQVGLFHGEECAQVLPVGLDQARELHKALGEAIEEIAAQAARPSSGCVQCDKGMSRDSEGWHPNEASSTGWSLCTALGPKQ